MPFHVCSLCGRESHKTLGDLKRIYGWTFKIVDGDEISACGDCNKAAKPWKPKPR
jgi:hypothetical protein